MVPSIVGRPSLWMTVQDRMVDVSRGRRRRHLAGSVLAHQLRALSCSVMSFPGSAAAARLPPDAAGVALSSSSSGGLFGLLSRSREMLGHGWQWVQENKSKVAGGAIVATAIGGYIVYRKVQPMIAQLRAEFQMMEQLAAQMSPQSTPAHKHAILIHRLEHNLTVGDLTLRQFASSIRKDLMARFDVDEIRSRLRKSNERGRQQAAGQDGESPNQSEEQRLLWEEFKVAGFSRTIAAVYTLAMLHALVKLQVSIVSRYVLVDQQAQAARAEAEAQAQANGGGGVPNDPQGAAAQQQVTSALQQQQQPTFLPPSVCEEVNRIYFSLSKHACSTGAGELASAISSLVRMELEELSVAAMVRRERVEGTMARVRERVEQDVLGLESKEAERPDDSASSAKKTTTEPSFAQVTTSPSGAPAHTAVFATPASPFARFLLPSSSSLSSLVTSISFPDPAQTTLASFRLAEMIAETLAVVGSQAFEQAVRESTRVVVAEMTSMMMQQTFAVGGTQQLPFTNSLVSSIKLFNTLLPDVSSSAPAGNSSSSAALSVSSPLFHTLADLPAVKELCAVVYLPADAITQDRQAGQLTTLEQLTENKQFAGDGSLQAAARSPIGVPSPAHIEEIKDASAGALAVRPTAAQMAAAVRDVKGLPVFDRL